MVSRLPAPYMLVTEFGMLCACRSVGIPFIGIGTGSQATRLFAEGAVCVFPDFSDADMFLRSMYEITNAA